MKRRRQEASLYIRRRRGEKDFAKNMQKKTILQAKNSTCLLFIDNDKLIMCVCVVLKYTLSHEMALEGITLQQTYTDIQSRMLATFNQNPGLSYFRPF